MLNDLHRQALALIRRLNHTAPSSQSSLRARSMRERVSTRLSLGEEGSNLVEFAMVLPLLLMLVTGIIGFGLVMNNKEELQSAAGQGVHALAIGENLVSDPCGAATTVITSATQLKASNITITFLNGGPNGTAMSGSSCANLPTGTVVSVKAQYPCSLSVIFRFAGTCSLTALETEPVP